MMSFVFSLARFGTLVALTSQAFKRRNISMERNAAAIQTMAAWIAAIADNVKNPIAGIGAALTIAEQQLDRRRTEGQWDPATVDRSLALIRTRLSSLSEYVTELVDFAKPTALAL